MQLIVLFFIFSCRAFIVCLLNVYRLELVLDMSGLGLRVAVIVALGLWAKPRVTNRAKLRLELRLGHEVQCA